MSDKKSRIHARVPTVSLRASVDANCAAQGRLRDEISLLEVGPAKTAAEKQLVALGTDLIALSVEMSVRLEQNAGPG